MKKNNIDEKKYYELIRIMHECGISTSVFDIASKMNFDLPYLFYDKLVLHNSEESKLQLSRNLLGIYGNLIASSYFTGLGYTVINEMPVYDKNGKEITKADIYFKDRYGFNNYCEIKTTSQIIDNIRNYVDSEESKLDTHTDKDEEIIKYKAIGKKLIKQVEKLSDTGAKVNVVVFKDCYIDDIILEKLRENNASIITLSSSVSELEEIVTSIVDNVDSIINKKKIANLRNM